MSELESYIFDRCLKYLEYRPRSKKEILDLIKKIFRQRAVSIDTQNEINLSIIKRLEDLKLIDDLAFATLVVNQKANTKRPKGPLAIKAALFQKGISREIIDSLTPFMLANPENLKDITCAKLAFYNKKNPKTARQNTLRFLIGRGFSFETAFGAIDSASSYK